MIKIVEDRPVLAKEDQEELDAIISVLFLVISSIKAEAIKAREDLSESVIPARHSLLAATIKGIAEDAHHMAQQLMRMMGISENAVSEMHLLMDDLVVLESRVACVALLADLPGGMLEARGALMNLHWQAVMSCCEEAFNNLEGAKGNV